MAEKTIEQAEKAFENVFRCANKSLGIDVRYDNRNVKEGFIVPQNKNMKVLFDHAKKVVQTTDASQEGNANSIRVPQMTQFTNAPVSK